MNQLKLDEDLAIREVLDDIIGMVERRVRLIESAGQRAEESRDARMAEQVKQLGKLMSDFLNLFDPILVKVRAYGASLKNSLSDSEAFLRSLVGIIDAGKTIDGSSATVQELEKDADEVQGEMEESAETVRKIEDLFERTRPFVNSEPARSPPTRPEPTFKPTPEIRPSVHRRTRTTRSYAQHAAPIAGSKTTFHLTDETRNRIEDLISKPGVFSQTSSPSSHEEELASEPSRSRALNQNSESRRLRPFAWAAPRPSTDQSAQSQH